jgi:hypothetical protein
MLVAEPISENFFGNYKAFPVGRVTWTAWDKSFYEAKTGKMK